MFLRHLTLTNYRNYRALELDFPAPLTVLQGGNAQGKTNLLEAVFFLATSRAPHARTDRQLIHWDEERSSPLPFLRIVGDIDTCSRPLRIEVTVALSSAGETNRSYRKQIRINGIPRRALDLVGLMRVVCFLPQDVDLIAGSPSGRRRYLDIALCQIDPEYCRRLSEYNQILPRRNSLLKQLAERGGDQEQLTYWEESLCRCAGYLYAARRRAVLDLAASVRQIHLALTGDCEELAIHYLAGVGSGIDIGGVESAEEFGQRLGNRLRETRRREIAAGTTMIGPHRDDLLFHIQGHDLHQNGSRGQQRTATMSLKLAEMELMTNRCGETPLLLLDDIMSELDSRRRAYLAEALSRTPQAIISTTDLHNFEADFLERCALWNVAGGALRPLSISEENSQENMDDAGSGLCPGS